MTPSQTAFNERRKASQSDTRGRQTKGLPPSYVISLPPKSTANVCSLVGLHTILFVVSPHLVVVLPLFCWVTLTFFLGLVSFLRGFVSFLLDYAIFVLQPHTLQFEVSFRLVVTVSRIPVQCPKFEKRRHEGRTQRQDKTPTATACLTIHVPSHYVPRRIVLPLVTPCFVLFGTSQHHLRDFVLLSSTRRNATCSTSFHPCFTSQSHILPIVEILHSKAEALQSTIRPPSGVDFPSALRRPFATLQKKRGSEASLLLSPFF